MIRHGVATFMSTSPNRVRKGAFKPQNMLTVHPIKKKKKFLKQHQSWLGSCIKQQCEPGRARCTSVEDGQPAAFGGNAPESAHWGRNATKPYLGPAQTRCSLRSRNAAAHDGSGALSHTTRRSNLQNKQSHSTVTLHIMHFHLQLLLQFKFLFNKLC